MKSTENKNNTIQRRKMILQLLADKGEVYVRELSKYFKVSEVTIRNDLEQLEQKNMLLRARGGAIRLESNVGVDQHLSEKTRLNYQKKARIGKKAASLIQGNDTIIVDSGTTTAELVKNLPNDKELTVITNAINIANHLLGKPNVSIIMLGGYLRKNSFSLIGPLAESSMKNFFVDKVFLGVDGFDTKIGIYTPNIEEAYLNQMMINNSREVILLADSTKFKRKSLTFICALDRIDTVITDDGISPEDRKRMEDSGVRVIVA
jgi:DeoR family transcriptional regulator, aga operon transcriptional repressor